MFSFASITKEVFTIDYMENILEELYLNGIHSDYYKQPDTPAYHEHLEQSRALEEKLLAGLKEEEKYLYRELRKNLDIIFDMEMMQSFLTGYILASQIMMDVAAQENNPKLIKMRAIARKLRRNKPHGCINGCINGCIT